MTASERSASPATTFLFVFMVGNAIAQSAQPIISYNFGAGASGRVIQARRIALATAVVCGMTAMGLFVCCPRILVGFFLDTDTPAALIAIEGFPLFASGFVFFIVNLTVIGYYQSLERVRAATTFALLRGFVLFGSRFPAAAPCGRDLRHLARHAALGIADVCCHRGIL